MQRLGRKLRGLSSLALLTLAVGATVQARTPYSDGEMRALESADEAKVREIRGEEITQLRIALGRRLAANRRADLYLRLAEIYLEGYRSEFLLEGRVHDKRIEKGLDDKFIDHSHSQPYLKSGIKTCQDILAFRIPFQQMDKIYYFLGFYFAELGNKKESLKYYSWLTSKYPQSPFASDAYKDLGDGAFEARQFQRAQYYYELAIKGGSADSRPRLQHKLAWSFYRTKQFDRAVETMKLAVAGATKSGEKLLNLKEEALRDMAVFMTETGRVDEAIQYFQTVAGDQAFYPKVLERLGKQYERNVEPAKATQVYESLLKTHPDSEEAFRVLVKLVDLDLRRSHFREAQTRISGAKIPSASSLSDLDSKTAVQNLKAMVRRTATEHHEKFRKKKVHADLEIAESYYSLYLTHFLASDDPRQEAPEIEMYLAEVKRELGRSQEASALYRKVVDSKDKRYAKEAGALWTASLAEAMRKAPSKSDSPSDLEKEFIDAADRLQDALGETNEGREASLKAAQVLAGYKSTQKDAISRIRKIAKNSPKSSQALVSGKLWIQLLVDRLASDSDAVDDLKDAIKELNHNSALMAYDQENGGKLKSLLSDQDTHMRVGIIAKEERAKNWSDAGKDYLAFAEESQQKDLAEKAYLNAISSYDKDSNSDGVLTTLGSWLNRYSKSPAAVDAGRSAATQFLIVGEFEAAAQVFEKLGRDEGDADSLETAARLYEGSGQARQSQKDWVAYLDLYKASPHRWSVALALARAQDRAGDEKEAASAYKYCVMGPPEYEAECGSRLADLYLRANETSLAKDAFARVASPRNAKKGDRFSPFVGYARYRLAELTEKNAHFDALKLPEAQLKKALNQRLDFLEPLSHAYLSVVDAGGPWAVAALHGLATWATSFADEVDQIVPAPGTSETGQIQFRKNLMSVSVPLRKKAADTWTQAYGKAVTAEIYSPVLPEIGDRLAEFEEPGISRAQGFRARFRLAGISADGGTDGKNAITRVREHLRKNPQDSGAWIDYGNLLWGLGKPLLARISYERALGLSPKNPAALNNRAVVKISSEGEEDWLAVTEGADLLAAALKQDEFFLTAKMNRAILLNYFRIFSLSKPIWETIASRAPSSDAQDGLATALQGLGNLKAAEAAFKKAGEMGASSGRFANLYHEAARLAGKGPAGASDCLSKLDDLNWDHLEGFEKKSAEALKKTCTDWKNRK